MRFIISFTVFASILIFYRWFILFVPHAEYAGNFFLDDSYFTSNFIFLLNFAELFMLLLFAFRQGFILRYRLSFYFFLFALFLIPSVIFSVVYQYNSIAYILFALSIFFLFPFFIQYVIINFNRFNSVNIFDLLVLSLFVAGIFTKLYQGYVHGPTLAPYLHPLHFALISRGGGVGASNHVALLMLVLFPLVSSHTTRFLIYFFVLISFSRLAWLVAFLIFLFQFRLHILFHKPLLAFFSFASFSFLIFYVDFNEFANRILAFNVLSENLRFQIWLDTLKIISDHYFLGSGFGSFSHLFNYYSNIDNTFSNPHNLFLTILVENGFLSLSIFILILIRSLIISFNIDRRFFLSILIFVFMGIFSGQLYEASLNKFSLFDLFIFGFVLSILEAKFIASKLFISNN